MDLQELDVLLGCHFSVAYFKKISNRKCWLSLKSVSVKENALFQMKEYMSPRRFKAITSVMSHTLSPLNILIPQGWAND